MSKICLCAKEDKWYLKVWNHKIKATSIQDVPAVASKNVISALKPIISAYGDIKRSSLTLESVHGRTQWHNVVSSCPPAVLMVAEGTHANLWQPATMMSTPGENTAISY